VGTPQDLFAARLPNAAIARPTARPAFIEGSSTLRYATIESPTEIANATTPVPIAARTDSECPVNRHTRKVSTVKRNSVGGLEQSDGRYDPRGRGRTRQRRNEAPDPRRREKDRDSKREVECEDQEAEPRVDRPQQEEPQRNQHQRVLAPV
jgi:hypothetical protein